MIVLTGKRVGEIVWISPDASAILVPDGNGIHIWRNWTQAGRPALLCNLAHARHIQFSADGKTIFATNDSFHAVDVATGSVREISLWGGYGASFGLSSRGDYLIVGQSMSGTPRRGGPMMGVLRGDGTGSFLWSRPVAYWWSEPVFLPGDESFVRVERALESPELRIVCNSTATGEEIRRSEPLIGDARSWAVSPDGLLAACRLTVAIHVYPIREPFTKPLVSLRNNGRMEFTAIAFHPSGRYLAATSNDATVKLYDTTSWEVARTFTWDIGRMRSIAFSPDGTLAVAGSDKGQVVIWDVDL